MQGRLIIDGNAVYEIDTECMQRMEKYQRNAGQGQQRRQSERSFERPDRSQGYPHV